MIRLPALFLLLAMGLPAQSARPAAASPPAAMSVQPAKGQVSRPAVAAVEQNMETRLVKADAADPFELLAFPQGVYLEGYGVVFTAKINLIVTPGLSPFRQQFTKQDIARVHARKAGRLTLLRDTVRDMLLSAAASLDPVPPGEQVVVSVALHYSSWEDTEGLPSQVIMQAERRKLLNRAAAPAAIRVQEY